MNLKFLIPLSALSSAAFLIAGCAGNGSSGPTGPGVRVVNGLNTVSQADVTVGTLVVGSPLLYATISGNPAHPYAIIPTGNQTVSLANLTAPATPLATTTVNLTTQLDVDAIAYSGPSGDSPQFLVLYDSLSVPVDAMVRLVNASAATGPVDIILTPVGSSNILNTLDVGAVSPAQSIPQTASYTDLPISGTYSLKLYHAREDTGTPLVNETVTLPASVSWTFIVLDPPAGQTAPVVLQVQDNQLHDIST